MLQVMRRDRAKPKKPLPFEHDGRTASAGSGQDGRGQHALAVNETLRRFPVPNQRYTMNLVNNSERCVL